MDAKANGTRWWHGAALYQIYVRSWRDTDADGYGDLPGVIAGLDYLQWLGIDGIWLSPTMPSPDQDWGYDVSDYLAVHPELGTLADMDKLIAEAGQRGIKVVLDLVPNHTSSAHAWFTDARSGRDSAHRSYYVWADPVKGESEGGMAGGGAPPNNWRDATGGSAWTLDDVGGQYYLHNFLPVMPDLNWWEPRVHEEFREIIRFWLDRGVAGFRVDVAHGLYKDAQLRDNPPLIGGGRLDGGFGLRPVYSSHRPETHAVYRDWRRIADGYAPQRLLLGETWMGDLGKMASYYGQNDELDLAFNFPFVFAEFSADALAGVVDQTLAALPAGASPVWMASNHDISRFPTRWGGGDERKARLALLVLATLPGTTTFYYGDEIAMTDVAVPSELRRDRFTPGVGAGGRDAERTPMQWNASPSAGFTADGVTPWLPFGDNTSRNVAAQRDDPGSTLRLTHDLLALRRSAFAGQVVGYERLPAPPGVWSYRSGPLLVTANFTGQPVALPDPPGEILLTTGPGSGPGAPLGAWQGLVTRSS
jgi:alpha-glucosidase